MGFLRVESQLKAKVSAPPSNILLIGSSVDALLIGGTDRMLISSTAVGAVLDTIATAADGAYSLRKLLTAYTGSAIRVRRTNDDAEQDIGFSSGELDVAALATFVGASNSGFIVTWYDQTGNSRNLTQATVARQLRIIATNTVDTAANGKPIAVNPDIADRGYATATFTPEYTGTTAASAWLGVPGTNNNARTSTLGKDNQDDYNAATRMSFGNRNGTDQTIVIDRNNARLAAISITNGVLYAIGGRLDGTNVTNKHSGSSNSAAMTAAFDVNQFHLAMQHPEHAPAGGTGWKQGEWIVWLTDPGTTDWDAVLANQRTYWGAT